MNYLREERAAIGGKRCLKKEKWTKQCWLVSCTDLDLFLIRTLYWILNVFSERRWIVNKQDNRMEKLLTHALMLVTSSSPFLSFKNQDCPLIIMKADLLLGRFPGAWHSEYSSVPPSVACGIVPTSNSFKQQTLPAHQACHVPPKGHPGGFMSLLWQARASSLSQDGGGFDCFFKFYFVMFLLVDSLETSWHLMLCLTMWYPLPTKSEWAS